MRMSVLQFPLMTFVSFTILSVFPPKELQGMRLALFFWEKSLKVFHAMTLSMQTSLFTFACVHLRWVTALQWR